ncbi:hypothetical protein COU20_01780 [Candidatus Kaiserbacteria bacterium CG10_big_fil_rev_8_21_14_0_10_59_10]|uniref:DoxX family protein n=1 Tax=Candidatus Kaiserbacteria bacterium CG10_big_fil_rev_8_21_14_0_10_59_10 TaxID=1974612 RepID=A0A2H0U7W9_9BACT|nr:MAG: hypothetical protein COU20_01780 [Candidatus Kaiserbacteria bacterium CG10_big_fil_rev_8_21_14_0_10_59_10]
MLSLFPELLFLAPLSATLIRAAAALVFLYAAWHHITIIESRLLKALGIAEVGIALLLLAGIYTQAAALAGALVALLWLSRGIRPLPLSTALLTFALTLSLLVTGAGALAFDLPL